MVQTCGATAIPSANRFSSRAISSASSSDGSISSKVGLAVVIGCCRDVRYQPSSVGSYPPGSSSNMPPTGSIAARPSCRQPLNCRSVSINWRCRRELAKRQGQPQLDGNVPGWRRREIVGRDRAHRRRPARLGHRSTPHRTRPANSESLAGAGRSSLMTAGLVATRTCLGSCWSGHLGNHDRIVLARSPGVPFGKLGDCPGSKRVEPTLEYRPVRDGKTQGGDHANQNQSRNHRMSSAHIVFMVHQRRSPAPLWFTCSVSGDSWRLGWAWDSRSLQ